MARLTELVSTHEREPLGYLRSVISTWIRCSFVLVVLAALAKYLRHRRARRITGAYSKAYAGRAGLGDEFTGWANEGTWPEK